MIDQLPDWMTEEDRKILELAKSNPVIAACVAQWRCKYITWCDCMRLICLELAQVNAQQSEMLLDLLARSTAPAIPIDMNNRKEGCNAPCREVHRREI